MSPLSVDWAGGVFVLVIEFSVFLFFLRSDRTPTTGVIPSERAALVVQTSARIHLTTSLYK